MKEKIYLDTSVISAYYDEHDLKRQKITQLWFADIREKYDLYISEIVELEINNTSDLELKAKLKKHILQIPSLKVKPEVRVLAYEYIKKDIFSEEESFRDALHISVATIHNIDILVSWNFHHIVTYDTKRKVNAVNTLMGYRNIEVVSPLELGGGKYE